MVRRASIPVVAALLVLLIASCSTTSGGDKIAVTATDTECQVATTTLASGKHVFAVTNKGGDVTEVYVYAAGDKVVGEVENIGPGTTRDLSVSLDAGAYELACKPGQKGNGIRTTIEVTGEAAAPAAPPDRRVEFEAAEPYAYAGLGGFTATAGQRIEFVMRNTDATLPHEFEVFGPDGDWLIEGHGVDPDIVVDNLPHGSYNGGDAQLDAAISYLQQEIKKKPVPAPTRPRARGLVPTLVLAGVLVVTVLGGFAVGDLLTGPAGAPVSVADVVRVQPLSGWEPAGRFDDPPGARLTRGSGSLDFLAIGFQGGPADLANEYVKQVLEPNAERLSVSRNVEAVRLRSGLTGVRVRYVGLFGRAQTPIEGEVTAVVSPSGVGAVFDAWAPQGLLPYVLPDMRTMIERAEVA